MRPQSNLRRGLALAGLLLAAAPAMAAADETTTTTVSGVVATELSVTVSTPPPAMALSRLTSGTTTSVLAISATTPWTLSVHDAGATTPGKMDKVDCVTRAATSGSLANAMQWSNALASTSGALSATAAEVATGDAGVSAATVLFTQPLASSDSVSAADCFELTTTWTVS